MQCLIELEFVRQAIIITPHSTPPPPHPPPHLPPLQLGRGRDFRKIRIDSYDSLPIEKILTFDNIIILLKLVVNNNKNNYYYIFRKRFV